MSDTIIQAQCVNLAELNNLFIDLEYQKPQSQGYSIYRSRSFNQKNKKYLQLDEIKSALLKTDKSKLQYIYLIGENSMAHPEFNHILRLCLNIAPVTIFSDGSNINDKKARFLKRVEEEGDNEIIFKIEMNHYDEKTNDTFSSRGSFRKAVHAIMSLNKYGFNPILFIKSNAPKDELKNGFKEIGQKFGFETEDINLCFVPDITQEQTSDESEKSTVNNDFNADCVNSRLYAKNGIYNCPMLKNDYRGRCGATLSDFSPKCYLETEKCNICKKYNQKLYANNWQ